MRIVRLGLLAGSGLPCSGLPARRPAFSTNPRTWLPMPASYATINVEAENADPGSLFNCYTRLVALRRSIPVLRDGGNRMLNKHSQKVLAYLTLAPKGEASAVIAVNLSAHPRTITLDLSAAGGSPLAIFTRCRLRTRRCGASALCSRSRYHLLPAGLLPYNE